MKKDIRTMARKKDYRQLLTTPYETGIRGFTCVSKYFQYYVPCIDSAQSKEEWNEEAANKILEKMIEKTGLQQNCRILKSIKPSSWKKDGLDENELDFEDSKILCDRYSNETELRAILRHIRNALAHGYLYVWRKRKGDFVFLVDYESYKKRITSKMMISMSILEQWKKILENEEGDI